jgi:hypothetical protein
MTRPETGTQSHATINPSQAARRSGFVIPSPLFRLLAPPAVG